MIVCVSSLTYMHALTNKRLHINHNADTNTNQVSNDNHIC